MLLGVVGKSNVGKSTFFSAATLVDAEISNRIFTTIEPNKGVTYVRVPCPCKTLNVTCNPNNSRCVNGTRFVPVKLTDVAGLVPGAHSGKGRQPVSIRHNGSEGSHPRSRHGRSY